METEDRVIVIRGPFTSDEIARMVKLLQDIEEDRPDETFQLILDDRQSKRLADDVLEEMRKINPLRPGYQRIIEMGRTLEQ